MCEYISNPLAVYFKNFNHITIVHQLKDDQKSEGSR